MGLTYLAGVDVEIDRDRELQLIESAANAGLDEAIEKLVSMYTYGDGVAQSLEKAIGWQDKLVGKYVDLSEDSMQEENIIVFLRNNMHLGKLAYDVKMYDKAERTYETSYNVGKMRAFGAVGKNIFSTISNFIKKYSGRNEYFTESYYYFLQSLRMCFLIQD